MHSAAELSHLKEMVLRSHNLVSHDCSLHPLSWTEKFQAPFECLVPHSYTHIYSGPHDHKFFMESKALRRKHTFTPFLP